MKIFDHYDVIIIGSGVAGLWVALNLESNLQVLVITKSKLLSGSTRWAQGGIAASLSNIDSPQKHYEDTLIAGRNLNNTEAVKILVTEGPERIKDLISLGMKFDLSASSSNLTLANLPKLALTREAAHTENRIIHAGGDQTGIKLQKFLIQELYKRQNIYFLENTLVYDLKKENSRFYVKLIIKKENRSRFFNFLWKKVATNLFILVKKIFQQKSSNKNDKTKFRYYKTDLKANNLVIATGGSGQIYKHTTNPITATGDGIFLAKKLNLKIENFNYYQFHPTALDIKNTTRKELKYNFRNQEFLISEAVRGEGGILVNSNGQRFMKNYDPRLELAPRDLVAWAIWDQLQHKKQKIYLDISHKNSHYLKKRFPSIYDKCQKFGIDMSKDLIPISPSAHYQIGGISVNLDSQTNLKNCYAVGEVSHTGVHGANRLASNSLLEGLVFAQRLAKKINSKKSSKKLQKIAKIKLEKLVETKLSQRSKLKEIELKIKNLMWENMSIKRDIDSVKFCLLELKKIKSKHLDLLDQENWLGFEVKSILECSMEMAKAELANNIISK